MARGLIIRRYGITKVNQEYYGAFRVKLEVTQSEDMDPNIFLYLRGPIDPYTNQYQDYFQTVASPVDMAEYPANSPDPSKQYAFFRKCFVELDFRANAQAEEFISIIKLEADRLIQAMNKLELLEELEIFGVGSLSGVSSHSSASM